MGAQEMAQAVRHHLGTHPSSPSPHLIQIISLPSFKSSRPRKHRRFVCFVHLYIAPALQLRPQSTVPSIHRVPPSIHRVLQVMALVLTVGGFGLGINGIIQVVDDAKQGKSLGFRDLCAP